MRDINCACNMSRRYLTFSQESACAIPSPVNGVSTAFRCLCQAVIWCAGSTPSTGATPELPSQRQRSGRTGHRWTYDGDPHATPFPNAANVGPGPNFGNAQSVRQEPIDVGQGPSKGRSRTEYLDVRQAKRRSRTDRCELRTIKNVGRGPNIWT